MNETALTFIGILLLTGAMAKSAQIPLHSWLPGSMEGLNGFKKFYYILIYIVFVIFI
jgi:NADH-ubiquinone oxidoreductase chain 5